MSSTSTDQKILVSFFLRNGVIRIPNKIRLKEGSQVYKKGYEIRFTAFNNEEELLILKILNTLGFKYGKSFKKSNRVIIPVYGYDSLIDFQKMIPKAKKIKL